MHEEREERAGDFEEGLSNAAFYFQAVLKWRALVFFTVLAAAIAAFVIALYTEPVYVSTARILIKPRTPSQFSSLRNLAILGGAFSSRVETDIQLLESRTLAEETMKKLVLDVKVTRDKRDTPSWRFKKILHIYTKVGKGPDKRLDLARLRLKEFSAPDGKRPFKLRIVPKGEDFEVIDLEGAFGAKGKVLGTGKVGEPFVHDDLSFTISILEHYDVTTFTLEPKRHWDAVDDFRDGIRVRELGFNSRVLSLSVSHTDPVRASEACYELIRLYKGKNLSIVQESAVQTLAFVDDQLELVEDELAVSRDEFDIYRSEHTTINLGAEARLAITQAGRMEALAEAARIELREANALKDRLAGGDTEDFILSGSTAIGLAIGSSLFERLVGYHLDRSNLLQMMTPEHESVKRIEAKTEELKETILTNLENQIIRFETQIREYNKIVGKYRAEIEAFPETESELSKLQLEVEVYKRLYNLLRERKQEAELSKASTITNVYVIDPPVPPELPERPKIKLYTAIGALMGLFFGAAIAVFLYGRGKESPTLRKAESEE